MNKLESAVIKEAFNELKAASDNLKRVRLLIERSEMITLLEAYSKFLEEHGYIDSDWRDEEPYAIDEFLKTQQDDKKRKT